MTPEQIELAKRLAAHPTWQWVDGMYAAMGYDPDYEEWGRVDGDVPAACHYPDLNDPATQGCLLSMLDRGLYLDLRWRPAIVDEHGQTMREEHWTIAGDRRDGTPDHVRAPELGTALAEALLSQWDAEEKRQ